MNPLIPGLITDEEFAGLQAARKYFSTSFMSRHHDPDCTRDHPRVMFAFWQSDFQGGKAPFWHVLSEGQSKHSTLSIQGLHDWGIFQ